MWGQEMTELHRPPGNSELACDPQCAGAIAEGALS